MLIRPFQKNKSSKTWRMSQELGYSWQILNSGTTSATLERLINIIQVAR
jgi:hypothetical protein